MATLIEIQTAYRAVNRTALSDADAGLILRDITEGRLTLSTYVTDLVTKAAATTGASVALLGFVTGLTPTSVKLDALRPAAEAQIASYAKMGSANPSLGAFEALGKAMASDPATGFATKYGQLSGSDFITTAYQSVYGAAPSAAALANLGSQVAYFVDLYTKAGFTAAQAALDAKGAVLGQIIGYAFLDPAAAAKSTLDDQVNLVLTQAAGGDTAVFGQALPLATPMPPVVTTPPFVPTALVMDFKPNLDTRQGSSDASSALALPGNTMLVGDDEASVLRVYSREGGVALKEISYASFLGYTAEVDFEASARIGNTLYFTGSHSNNKSGVDQNSREVIFSATVSGSGVDTTLTFNGKYTGMEAALTAWDHSGNSGKPADYFAMTANAAAGAPERDAGFSIEGLTFSPDNSAMWLGFRAPVTGGTSLHKALIVPVTNYGAVLDTGATPMLGQAIELDLGGRGIRSIDKNAAGQYVIIAGPAGPASADVADDFRIYTWDGVVDGGGQAIHLVQRVADLDALRDVTGGSFESLVEVPDNLAEGTWLQLLQDNGDTIWPGKTQVSKDLPASEQHFQGNWIKLGGVAPADITAPLLVRSSPADEVTGVAIGSKIVLTFNEPVQAGSGDFVLKAGGTVVRTFAATDAHINYEYNTITIDMAGVLTNGQTYSLEVAAGAVADASGNAFAGIAAGAVDFTTAPAGTTLATGDIAFVGFNSDGSNGDAFAFVLLKDVTAGTAIRFTDKEWTGTAFNSGEGDLLWTATGNLAAGTVVTIQPDLGTPTASAGTLTGTGGGLSKSGEQVFAITGTVAAPRTFLAAIGIGSPAGGFVTTGADLDKTSFLPSTLTLGVNAVNLTVINANYTGMLTGTPDDLRVAIANSANWAATGANGSTITGGKLDLGHAGFTVDGATTLSTGDIVFLGINTDSTDAFAFMIARDIGAGTKIGFSDRDYSATSGMPTSGESAYIWTADRAYAAGTVITIQPDVANTVSPIASLGSTVGRGGGLSATAETVYAFQGSIAGLSVGAAGAITVQTWLAAINAGGAAAGDTPAGVTMQNFGLDNALYTGSRSAADIPAFKALALDNSNWSLNDATAFPLFGGSFFV